MQVYQAYFVEDGPRWSEPLLVEEVSDDRAIEIIQGMDQAAAGFELWLEDHLIIRAVPEGASAPGPARVELGPSPHAHPSVIET